MRSPPPMRWARVALVPGAMVPSLREGAGAAEVTDETGPMESAGA